MQEKWRPGHRSGERVVFFRQRSGYSRDVTPVAPVTYVINTSTE